MVCDSMNRKCMLQFCSNCPGRQQLQNLLQKLFDDNYIEPEDQIEYKQWMHTDGTKLVDLKLPCNEFLDLVLEKFDLKTSSFHSQITITISPNKERKT